MTDRRAGAIAVVLCLSLVGLGACASPPTTTTTTPPGTPATPIAPTEPTETLYVSPNGDDANSGSEQAPIRTIVRAADMVDPGTKVVVADGTYTGAITTKTSGTAEERIAFVAANPGGAKVVADSGDVTWLNTGDYVDIVGFDISGSTTDGLTTGGSYGRIVDNRVHDFTGGNCIATANADYDMHDIDVIGNVTSGCGNSSLDHGIYVSHTRGVVANNISYDNAGFGIQCWHNCNELVISNNLVFGNPEGGIVVGQGDGPNYGEVPADGFVVSNNIAVGNGRDGIRESGATGPHNEFLNNILWNNDTDRINLKTGSARGTLVEDPEFVDFRPDGTGNYRLLPGSPALGRGVQQGAPPTDIDGAPRPPTGVDIGVYQH